MPLYRIRSVAVVIAAALSATIAILAAGCRREETAAPGDPAPAAPAASAPAGSTPAAASAPASPELIGGGRYLVTIIGCNDCHTPHKMGKVGPEPDMSRLLSGHPESSKVTTPPKLEAPWMMAMNTEFTAFAGPWGISYAANLTPDENTGIGIWTEDMFIRAMRTGKHMGTSRTILPPMPWPWFAQMRDEELKAVFAYLKSIPPIRNRVPDPTPPVVAP